MRITFENDETYWGVAVLPFTGTCASKTVHVTCFGTDAEVGFPSHKCKVTFMSSVHHKYHILAC